MIGCVKRLGVQRSQVRRDPSFDTLYNLLVAHRHTGGMAASAPLSQAARALLVPVGARVPAGPPGFVSLAPLSCVPLGLSRAWHLGAPLVVVRARDGRVRALEGLCPHRQGELALGDIEDVGGRLSVVCPRHRTKFAGGLHVDACDGRVSCPSAPSAATTAAGFNSAWRVPTYATCFVASAGAVAGGVHHEHPDLIGARVPADTSRPDEVWVFVATRPSSGSPTRAATVAGAAT